MARAEVTIIGAGIFGLACAWELVRRGTPVRLIETASVGAGSSGGTVGALAPHAPDGWNAKKQVQLDALIAAESWWREVRAAGGVDPGYARAGRVQPVTDAAQLPRLQARIAAAGENWPAPFTLMLTDSPETALRPVSPTGLWLVDTLTARLAPRRACAALAAAIRAAGSTIEEGTPALTPDRALPGVAIWATGAAGLAALSADLGRPMGNGVKGQSASLRHAAPDAPQVFADGLHIVPHADGTVGIGSTSERDVADLTTDAQLDALIARARDTCPALAEAPVIDRWAGIRPRATSRAPLVGPWPGRPGHLIANGGFKIGFGMAQPIAAMLADLICDGQDRIPPEFKPPA